MTIVGIFTSTVSYKEKEMLCKRLELKTDIVQLNEVDFKVNNLLSVQN